MYPKIIQWKTGFQVVVPHERWAYFYSYKGKPACKEKAFEMAYKTFCNKVLLVEYTMSLERIDRLESGQSNHEMRITKLEVNVDNTVKAIEANTRALRESTKTQNSFNDKQEEITKYIPLLEKMIFTLVATILTTVGIALVQLVVN